MYVHLLLLLVNKSQCKSNILRLEKRTITNIRNYYDIPAPFRYGVINLTEMAV